MWRRQPPAPGAHQGASPSALGRHPKAAAPSAIGGRPSAIGGPRPPHTPPPAPRAPAPTAKRAWSAGASAAGAAGAVAAGAAAAARARLAREAEVPDWKRARPGPGAPAVRAAASRAAFAQVVDATEYPWEVEEEEGEEMGDTAHESHGAEVTEEEWTQSKPPPRHAVAKTLVPKPPVPKPLVPKSPVPKQPAWKPAKSWVGTKTARLPEDLGFDVSRGVVRKGWEIGEMEDGIRPSEDGEPDVFLSHSYSDNCRRVDMALFECDCPNSLTCCSHAYAALVALPTYRHRAAVLWAIRCQTEGGNNGLRGRAGDGSSTRFEVQRDQLKAAMLQRLPLEDLVDASIEAALGLWARVEWLRKDREPKLDKYWAERVERAVSDGGSGNAGNHASNCAKEDVVGAAAQKRFQDLLGKLQMNTRELAPLLLALGEGSCKSRQAGTASVVQGQGEQDRRWTKLSQSFWSKVAGDTADSGKSKTQQGVPLDDVKIAATSAVEEAAQSPDWELLRPVERIWRAEVLTLKSLGADSFAELRVPRVVTKDADQVPALDLYRSFVEMLVDWQGAPAALEETLAHSDSGAAGAEIIEREAMMVLEEVGRDAFAGEGGGDAFAVLLNGHLGRLGQASDWRELADRALSAPASEDNWRQGAVLSATASTWEPAGTSVADGLRLAELGAEGWDNAVGRLISCAPPLTELRVWLFWDQIFESQLGPLRAYLRRAAAGLGIVAFELPGGGFVKLDAAAGTSDAWAAALRASDALLAAEALLAFCHGCGGLRAAPLREAMGPAYSRMAESNDNFAGLAGEILAVLPRPFGLTAVVAEFLLSPLSAKAALGLFARTAGECLAQSAALRCGAGGRKLSGIAALLASAGERLKTGQRSSGAREVKMWLPNECARKQQSLTPISTSGLASDGCAVASAPPPSTASNPETCNGAPMAPDAPAVVAEHHAVPGAAHSGEVLVACIRREEFGFDGEAPTGGDLQARQNARLARALRRLAGELYGSDVHWQLELLQNADDNTYDDDLEPTAEFLLRDGEVVFRCNEAGFREADIRSICDIGNSSKVGTAKYAAGGRVVATGEKGLGFKAVFALTNTPRIFSGPYRIEFDALHASGIGYVLPRWLGDADAASEAEGLLEGGWGSALRMPLRPDLRPKQEELYRRLADLPPSALLFLKRLRAISVGDALVAGGISRSVRMRRTDEASGNLYSRWEEQTLRACVEVSRGSDPPQLEMEQWLLLRRRFAVPEGLAKPGISAPPSTTLVELALPLTPEGGFDTARGVQPVFAFLPVRSFGFAFALQADWAVSSSREELLSGCAWNEFLKSQLPKLLLELVHVVKKEAQESPLRWSFYSAVPPLASAPQYFRPAVAQLHAALRNCECMLTDEGSFVIPRMAMRCSPELRAAFAFSKPSGIEEAAAASAPLREALRSQGYCVVHERVEATVSGGLLDSLGVQHFGAAHLLRLLPVAADTRPALSEWRRALALLDELLDATPRADVGRLVQVARRLPLLPLEGGAWVAADDRVFLPPAAEDARGFPRALLGELRAVDPLLLAEDGEDEGLAAARLRKLLRRLGVMPLTPRQVLRDVIAPLFRDRATPCVVAAAALAKPVGTYLAFAGFLASHKELADELSDSPVGWPLVGMEEVAVGSFFTAPALHSPRAASFLEALRGSPVQTRTPAAPPGLELARKLGGALETLGLALPGPLVEATVCGDWRSPEFEALATFCAAEGAKGAARARLLAQALDAAWSRYERYAARADGSTSAFMSILRGKAWLPADDVDGSEVEDSIPRLLQPADLCASTPALRAVFTEVSLLSGRMTTAVSGSFAEALGVVVEPSVSLAVSVLRSFGRRSPVGPEGATPVYSYLQREGADLAPLRASATVVVGLGEPALAPGDVVWEDASKACALPALLPLYGARWRAFFVLGLGVPERPTAEQAMRRVDHLASLGSGLTARIDSLWAVLLFIAERLEVARASVAAAGEAGVAGATEESGGAELVREWEAAAAALRPRRCLPLVDGGFGVPSEGVVFVDDCPHIPAKIFKDMKATAPLAALPPGAQGAARAAHWLPLLRAVGLRPLSAACEVAGRHGETRVDRELSKSISALLPLAQRYLFHRHRSVHDSTCALVASRVKGLRVRQVDRPLRLLCSLRVREDDAPSTTLLDVDAFLDDAKQATGSTDIPPQLLSTPDAPLPAVCVELARLLVPPLPPAAASASDAALAASAARHAREALTTFLASAAASGAAGAEAMCEALGVGETPCEVLWPTPAEVVAAAAAEAAAVEAAAKPLEALSAWPSEHVAAASNEQGDQVDGYKTFEDGPLTKQRRGSDVLEVADVDGLGGGAAGDGDFGMVTAGSAGGHKDMGGGLGGQSRKPDDDEDDEDNEEDCLEGAGGGDGGKCGKSGKGGKGKPDGKRGKTSTFEKEDKDAVGEDVEMPEGRARSERPAGEVGDVFAGLPARRADRADDAPKKFDGEKPPKAFKTRVYDLDDVRLEAPKVPLGPIADQNNLSEEERSRIGRWGEEFVHKYLQHQMDEEEGGEAPQAKRVVWVNELEETGFQYDLRIENRHTGEVEAYVEVKTSRARDKHLFEMSYKEWNFAQKEGNKFVIFRVSNAGKSDVELMSITNPFRQWKDMNLGLCISF